MAVCKFRFYVILLLLALCAGAFAQQEKRRSPVYYFNLGEQHLEKHNWLAARDAFDECLRQDPRYVDAYYSRAIVHEHFDSLNRALTDYNIYLEFRPEHHEALFARSQLRLRIGQYDLAKDDLLKLLEMPPGATTTVIFRQDPYSGKVDQAFTAKGADKAYLFTALGLADIKRTDYAGAIRYFDSALVRTPGDPDLLVNRGSAYQLKGDTARAIADYQMALSGNPNHSIARHNLGVITGRLASGSNQDPVVLNEIDVQHDLPFEYAERGYSSLQKGAYAEAISNYDHAIRLSARDPDHFLNRGLAKEKLKDFTGAYQDYSQALKLNSGYDKAWLNRGNVLARLGKLNEAVEDYTMAISQSPRYAAAFLNRAMVLNRLKKKSLACQDLQTAEKFGAAIEPAMWKGICGNPQ